VEKEAITKGLVPDLPYKARWRGITIGGREQAVRARSSKLKHRELGRKGGEKQLWREGPIFYGKRP